jgi:periplasmic protein TonB
MTFRTPDPRAIRGAAAPTRLIAIAAILVLAAAAAWWFFGRAPGTVVPRATTATTPAATPETAAAPAAAVSDELTVDQLYREARKAMSENRIAAPAGNNALEFYLKILAKEPDDSGPKDALRELFPFATGAAEDQINQGNFDEANRIISLLAQADPSNYSLTILRSKLDAKKKQVDREQAQAAAAAAAASAAAARPAAPNATGAGETAAATATPAPPSETPASTAPSTSTPAEAPPAATDSASTTASTTPAPAPATRPAAPAAEPAGETREATPTSAPAPVYPIAAARNRQEGWVEVEFTVGADGSVQNAHVTASSPPRIFDHEAIVAVQHAKYEPRLENGKPVASTLHRRIEFKLSGQ